ncbi:MAG: phage tail protein [Gammaproteobacteria bacterium]|jgi:phage tail-like protein|nr:phage tail protein [Gammaproteobacteria bacterium]
MPLLNPVPAFNFTVFMFDAKENLFPQTGAEWGMALGSLAIGVGKTLLYGSFSEVTGLNAELEIEEYHEGGNNIAPLQLMKWGRYPNVVLKRGVTPNTDIWDWSYQVLYGSKAPIRKNGFILLNDRGGGILGAADKSTGFNLPGLDLTPIALWYFRNGLPEKLQGPSLNAAGNDIAIESLEISHEGLVRIGPAMIPGIGETLTQLGI